MYLLDVIIKTGLAMMVAYLIIKLRDQVRFINIMGEVSYLRMTYSIISASSNRNIPRNPNESDEDFFDRKYKAEIEQYLHKEKEKIHGFIIANYKLKEKEIALILYRIYDKKK